MNGGSIGDVNSFLVQENIRLRQQVSGLEMQVHQFIERQDTEWASAQKFLCQFHHVIAGMIRNDWQTIGGQLCWSAEQIAMADVLAATIRQELYNKSAMYEKVE